MRSRSTSLTRARLAGLTAVTLAVGLIAAPAPASAAETTWAVPSWGLDRISQRNLPLNGHYRANATGQGVHVYILDSVIRTTHKEFGDRAKVLGKDVIGGGDVNKCTGHGTAVAGIVGGATVGVAHNVTLHSVQVRPCDGSNPPEWAVVDGINWVTDNVQKPAVINLSLKVCRCGSKRVDEAVDRAINAGITVVASAGNDGTSVLPNGTHFPDGTEDAGQTPARVPRAITVAASELAKRPSTTKPGTTEEFDKRWANSNWGAGVDLFAPGAAVDGLVSVGDNTNLAEKKESGTSFATAYVTGVAALYLEKNPRATPQQVHDGIVANATPGKVEGLTVTPNSLLYSLF